MAPERVLRNIIVPTQHNAVFTLANDRSKMPRYFFNMVEAHVGYLLKDFEGSEFSGADEARKEAVGLAADIERHGLRGRTQAWIVVVCDENRAEVLRVPLSEIHATKVTSGSGFGSRVSKYLSSFSPRTFLSLLAAGTVAVILQAVVITVLIVEKGGSYQTASVPTEGAIVVVRFVPHASAAEITRFLDAYQATLVGGPRPGGLYRLRIADTTLPQTELANLARRMAQESVAEFAAAVQ